MTRKLCERSTTRGNPQLWNSLPAEVTSEQSFVQFTKRLKTQLLEIEDIIYTPNGVQKRMIRKKTERNGQTKYLYNISPTTMVLILSLTTTENSCCVVTPREFLATVGEVVSFGCNARPNNESQGTVSNFKLENEDKSETTIFQPPVYGRNGEILTQQSVAEGYFLSELDEHLVNATIQINETQLKHGGRYECSCTTAKASTGSGNLFVLDKLSFVLNGGNSQTPGEALLDLNCSFSFSGSISSAVSVDLTIQDANGTELAAKRNLSLSRSQEGSHHVNYSFITHRNLKELNFTCQMKFWKVWNRFSSELLRSMTANYIYSQNSGHMTTSLPYSSASETPATVSEVTFAVVVVSVLVVVVLLVAMGIYFILRKRCTCKRNSSNFVVQKCSTSTQYARYEGGKSSTEHPTGAVEGNSTT